MEKHSMHMNPHRMKVKKIGAKIGNGENKRRKSPLFINVYFVTPFKVFEYATITISSPLILGFPKHFNSPDKLEPFTLHQSRISFYQEDCLRHP